MEKNAVTEHPVHELIARRWSPRAFADRDVEPAKIASLLEAARWAPSCFNDQPWTFLVAPRTDAEGFERLASCLVEGNAWAKKAGVLICTVARGSFAHNGKPNRHAFHDIGLAVENLVLQGEALGLSAHQMAGFDARRAREVLNVPEGHDPVTMVALGYRGEPDTLPDPLKQRETAARSRRALSEIAFGAGWETPLDALGG